MEPMSQKRDMGHAAAQSGGGRKGSGVGAGCGRHVPGAKARRIPAGGMSGLKPGPISEARAKTGWVVRFSFFFLWIGCPMSRIETWVFVADGAAGIIWRDGSAVGRRQKGFEGWGWCAEGMSQGLKPA